jgi:hypothetical protein
MLSKLSTVTIPSNTRNKITPSSTKIKSLCKEMLIKYITDNQEDNKKSNLDLADLKLPTIKVDK